MEKMNHNNRPVESSGSMTLGDIYFVIFRHKWKIITLSLAGIVAAVMFYMLHPPVYQSEAQLFIRYITDLHPVSAPLDNGNITAPGDRGGGIINAEISILTSFDLAKQVAATIGPEKILAKVGGGKDLLAAAGVVHGGLAAYAPPNSSVIGVVFYHADPTVVQPVLAEVIADYQSMHKEIHGSLGTDDFAADAAMNLRAQIAQTERDLMIAKTNAGIISLEDAQNSVAGQITVIRSQLLTVELDLDTRREMAANAAAYSPKKQPVTNAVAAVQIAATKIDEYNRICTRLVVLQRKTAEFMAQGYSEDSVVNKDITAQIIEARDLKQKLEKEIPGLAGLDAATLASSGQAAAPDDGPAQMALLESKKTVLNQKLTQLRSELLRIEEIEPKIMDLTRKEQYQENTLQYFTKSLDDAQINDTLGAGKITGIKAIEQPTPPAPADSKRLKTAGMFLGGGFFIAFGLAFLIEMVLDRSIKRPVEIESKLKIPLFLSVPDVNRNGSRRRSLRAAKVQIGNSKNSGEQSLEIAPWSTNHSLRAFYEALRDRIVVYFDVRNLVHNPKLVAVTSANQGAGVTTMAMGLAASLSETGEGNVLLVDMNAEQGAVQQFYKGKPGCHLEDAFEKEKRGGALMQDNLYVVTERSSGDKLPRILPKRFNLLLPKFKASDYDYIIFDMPPVTQTSVTPRLAGFMDMVLLVVEAEKTDQEVVRRANLLLKESKANVIAVLNKARKYVPEKLHQEFLSDR
jgi:polysaccharide biosynthesis transport protein